jgi:hypothetical protein
MTWGGIAALIHGVFPFLFKTTGSRITRELAEKLDLSRPRSARTRRGDAV